MSLDVKPVDKAPYGSLVNFFINTVPPSASQ